ncbi:unnamed protein product [Bursaphelenchus okinawaensis]|uniref:Paired domain-containing protein n=1 Tax=Bursaphelenchus okinawaensis TaxID=465554 RepID=A0A811KSK0_9BILA|nr:unnamed protein product [Bursaphelenchus okinawaensis]CAG9112628.1 unnamed protein product [Bursaphelenchus okinawaensis]
MDTIPLPNQLNAFNWMVETATASGHSLHRELVLPIDTIGESARNRFGRPYISGRPLLACDRKKIIEMYKDGARKITIARTIGVTHSCVSKVIRKFEETGDVDNKSSRTASCACPGEADAHDPRICRHVKFRKEMNLPEWKPSFQVPKKKKLVVFSIEWILSEHCAANSYSTSKLKTTQIELVIISAMMSVMLCRSCTPTQSANHDSASGGVCCPQLTATTVTDSNFANGDMTFTYDNDACPQTVTATCSIPSNAGTDLGTSIVANDDNFLATAAGTSSTFPGTCDSNGQWEMGDPPIVIQTIECRLTNE